jgi:hypothetical protein
VKERYEQGFAQIIPTKGRLAKEVIDNKFFTGISGW